MKEIEREIENITKIRVFESWKAFHDQELQRSWPFGLGKPSFLNGWVV